MINLSFFNKGDQKAEPIKKNEPIVEQNEKVTPETTNSSSMLDLSKIDSEVEVDRDASSFKISEPPLTDQAKAKQVAQLIEPTVETEEEDEESDGNIQNVRVGGDPFHICLSSTNFDQDLIDYLQIHPLTKKYVSLFYILQNSDNFKVAFKISTQMVLSCNRP